MPGVRSAAAVVTALLVLTGCGGADEEAAPAQFTGVPLEAQDPGPVHVHGLGYDAKRDILYAKPVKITLPGEQPVTLPAAARG